MTSYFHKIRHSLLSSVRSDHSAYGCHTNLILKFFYIFPFIFLTDKLSFRNLTHIIIQRNATNSAQIVQLGLCSLLYTKTDDQNQDKYLHKIFFSGYISSYSYAYCCYGKCIRVGYIFVYFIT